MTTCDQADPLHPNAPPTNLAMTRTFSGGMPNPFASFFRTAKTHCDESQTVSRSPLHEAIVACGSSGLWVSKGVSSASSFRAPPPASPAAPPPPRAPRRGARGGVAPDLIGPLQLPARHDLVREGVSQLVVDPDRV